MLLSWSLSITYINSWWTGPPPAMATSPPKKGVVRSPPQSRAPARSCARASCVSRALARPHVHWARSCARGLYMQEGMDLSGGNKKKDKKGVEKALHMAERIGLKVIEASKHDLNMVVDNRPHQGLVLDASPLEMVNTKELEPVRVDGGKAPVWIALDEVMDPQNLGAIIRSAYFFGAEGVVLCAKNSAPLSGVVSKASAGSLELIELLSCRNMMQFLSSSAENGWRVLGGTVAPKATPLSEVATGEPTILVLGSEGTGLRPLVERSCTQLVKISGNVDGYVVGAESADTDADGGEEGDNYSGNQDLKSFLAVESLNVSVAAGVLLYHLAGKNVCPVSDKPRVSLM